MLAAAGLIRIAVQSQNFQVISQAVGPWVADDERPPMRLGTRIGFYAGFAPGVPRFANLPFTSLQRVGFGAALAGTW